MTFVKRIGGRTIVIGSYTLSDAHTATIGFMSWMIIRMADFISRRRRDRNDWYSGFIYAFGYKDEYHLSITLWSASRISEDFPRRIFVTIVGHTNECVHIQLSSLLCRDIAWIKNAFLSRMPK